MGCRQSSCGLVKSWYGAVPSILYVTIMPSLQHPVRVIRNDPFPIRRKGRFVSHPVCAVGDPDFLAGDAIFSNDVNLIMRLARRREHDLPVSAFHEEPGRLTLLLPSSTRALVPPETTSTTYRPAGSRLYPPLNFVTRRDSPSGDQAGFCQLPSEAI